MTNSDENRPQTDPAQLRDIENGTTETIDALINDSDHRACHHLHVDSTRETRWKKRYWSAAIVAIVCVLYVGANMNRQQAEIKKLTKEVQQKSVLIEDLSNQVEERTLKKIWFDRKREHSNEAFQKVDDKYPAGYEVWDGEKLIERWHWRIEGQPKTDQFGEYITRCVALYDNQNSYAGFSQTVMDHYPSENAGESGYYKNNPKPDSIKFTFDAKQSMFELVSDNMGIRWERGKLKHTYLLTSDFKHDYKYMDRKLTDIIQTLDHYKYLVHVSKMFGFIDKKIIKPFDEINPQFAVQLENIRIINDAAYAQTVVRLAIQLKEKKKISKRNEFAKIIDELPPKQKQEWQRFTRAMEKNPTETIKFIEQKYKNEQQTAPDLKQIFSRKLRNFEKKEDA